MPTPFSHMNTIYQLLDDTDVPSSIRETLNAHRPAFLLGSVAPDARLPDVLDSRSTTHFYHYTKPITEHPWKVMLHQYPQLNPPKDDAHRAFIAGYVAHLAMDEVWTLDMLVPHFAFADWGSSQQNRFFILHTMLITLDERDLADLPDWIPNTLHSATPNGWLPFMPQPILTEWQDLIYNQIKPGGESQTLEIFGGRIGRSPEELRRLVDDQNWMQQALWDHVSHDTVREVEDHMYQHARESLIRYMNEFAEPA